MTYWRYRRRRWGRNATLKPRQVLTSLIYRFVDRRCVYFRSAYLPSEEAYMAFLDFLRDEGGRLTSDIPRGMFLEPPFIQFRTLYARSAFNRLGIEEVGPYTDEATGRDRPQGFPGVMLKGALTEDGL